MKLVGKKSIFGSAAVATVAYLALAPPFPLPSDAHRIALAVACAFVELVSTDYDNLLIAAVVCAAYFTLAAGFW